MELRLGLHLSRNPQWLCLVGSNPTLVNMNKGKPHCKNFFGRCLELLAVLFEGPIRGLKGLFDEFTDQSAE